MNILEIEQEDPMVALESIANTASLEAFSLRTIGNRLADILPSLAHSFRQYAYTHKSDKLDLTPPDINMPVLKKALAGAVYLEIGKFAVSVPQGHTGNLPDYLAAVLQSIEFSNGIIGRMTAFNQFLSALISTASARQSTKDLAAASTAVEKERDALRAKLGEYSKANSRSARRPLQETFRSLNEIETSAEMTFQVVQRASQLNLAEINTLINDAVELLDELERRANEGSIEDMSPQTYKSLASSTLTMARDAEFHSILCFKSWEVKDCMEVNAKELIKALRY